MTLADEISQKKDEITELKARLNDNPPIEIELVLRSQLTSVYNILNTLYQLELRNQAATTSSSSNLTDPHDKLLKSMIAVLQQLSPEKKNEIKKMFKNKEESLIPGIIRTTETMTLLRHFTSCYFSKYFGPQLKSINIGPKVDGVQKGCTATIELIQDQVKIKYFVKTHQQSSSSTNGDGVLDPREIFVYVFLSKLKWSGHTIGPEEIHFYSNYLNPFDEFYIATKDVEIDTFQRLTDEPNFAQMFKTDSNYSNGLLLADLVSKILFLDDTTNNPGNFGFTEELKLKIIDFGINEDSLLKKDMLARFLQNDFSLTNKDTLSRYFYMEADMKKQLAGEIFSHLDIDKILEQSIEETFKLLDRNFTQYLKNIKDYEYEDRINKRLNTYVSVIKENFERFSKEFQNKV